MCNSAPRDPSSPMPHCWWEARAAAGWPGAGINQMMSRGRGAPSSPAPRGKDAGGMLSESLQCSGYSTTPSPAGCPSDPRGGNWTSVAMAAAASARRRRSVGALPRGDLSPSLPHAPTYSYRAGRLVRPRPARPGRSGDPESARLIGPERVAPGALQASRTRSASTGCRDRRRRLS